MRRVDEGTQDRTPDPKLVYTLPAMNSIVLGIGRNSLRRAPLTHRLLRRPLFRLPRVLAPKSAKILGGSVVLSLTLAGTDIVLNEKLESDPQAETYEMGLYSTSQNELKTERERKKKGHFGWLYSFKLYLQKYLWEPIVTFGRFVELMLLFSPVILALPICYFGRRDAESSERSGTILWYKYIKFTAEMAGASFIKLGQWAASRHDIFPEQLCKELGNLHSDAKPHPFHATRKSLETAFSRKLEDVFEEFIEKPLGCGAIAQVYLGKVRSDLVKESPWVAVKVLHPNVEATIERDLRLMRIFASAINALPTMEWLSLPQEVEQFSLLMKLQLDLRIEGMNLEKFTHNFANKKDIRFPKAYMDLTSRKVLVEEYIHGVPMSKLLALSSNFGKGLSKEVSDKGLDAFLQMLILDNFVHADLHPGNIMVRFHRPHSSCEESNKLVDSLVQLDNDALQVKLDELQKNGYKAKICFFDAGIVTELNEKNRVNFIELFNALSEFDGYLAGELMVEKSRTPNTVIDREVFALKVEKLVDQIKQRTFTLGSVSIGDLLDKVLKIVRTHHVRMEGDFITVIVAILLIEGIGRRLDPDLDLFARFVNYAFINLY